MIEIRRPRPTELESLYVLEVACFEEAFRWDEDVFVQELKKSEVWVADQVECACGDPAHCLPVGTCQSVAHSHPPYMLHSKSLECASWKETKRTTRETVGFLCARVKNGGGYITSIDVSPDHRKKGIGAKLLYAAEEFFKGQGMPRIWLEVEVNNPAQKLYFDCGYRASLVRPKWYDDKIDCLVMTKIFTAQTPTSSDLPSLATAQS